MRLALLAFLLVIPESWALATPPNGCLPASTGAKLRPIAEVGSLQAWVQVAPGPSSSACVRISGCAWRIDEADLMVGGISKYASPNPDGICDLVSNGDEICADPTELEQQYGALARLVTRSLSGTETYCAPGQNLVRNSGNAVFAAGGDTMSLLTLPVGNYCLNLLGVGASSAVVMSTSCLNSVGVSALYNRLKSEFFALDSYWLVGLSGNFLFGLPVDLSGATTRLINAPIASGFPTSSYVQNWLSSVHAAAKKVGPGNDLDRGSDPLAIPSQSETAAALHWIAAAVARLEPTPFDASTGWSEQQTQNAAARDWMATIELDDPADFSGTHFRAELARN